MAYDTTILNRNATQSITNSTWTRVSWDNEERDDGGAANLGTSATKITIPVGVTKVRFVFYASWANNSTGQRLMDIEKNGAGTIGSGTVVGIAMKGAVNESGQQIVTKWLTCVATDFFEFWVFQSGGTNSLSGSAVFGGPTYVQAEFAP